MEPGGIFQPLVMSRNLSTRSARLPFSILRMKRHCFSVLEGRAGGKAWSVRIKTVLRPPSSWCLMLQLIQDIVELLKLYDVLVFSPKSAITLVLASLPSQLEMKSPTGTELQLRPPMRFGTAIARRL